jgi:hypothetical protein
MKNVQLITQKLPAFRIPMEGLPPLSGWAIRYVGGMEENSNVKSGDWLSQWHVGPEDVVFAFEHGLHMCFNQEADAVRAVDYLLKMAEIRTKVVKIGG